MLLFSYNIIATWKGMVNILGVSI